jgi:hypothetical protein
VTARSLFWPLVAALSVGIAGAQNPRPGPPQQPSRDTPASTREVPAPSGRILGRILAADSGRPLKRARVQLNAAELPEGRGALSDNDGIFEFTDLPAGRYTLNASKTGYISLSYGQRRPFQAGTPLQLGDGQQLKGLEFRLPRGGVIAGHILDEEGDAVPGAMVRVLRYQYLQGDRRLVPAGTAQTDDKGQYRVWGLNPGDYYISALTRLDFGGRGAGPGRGGPGFVGNAAGAILGGNIAALFAGGDDQDRVAYAPTFYPGVASVETARPVTVGVSEEVLDINFNLQLVRTARIAGLVNNPDGSPVTSGNVTMTSDGAAAGGGRGFGGNYGSRIQWDGTFTMSNVAPGRYMLRARGDDSVVPQYATQPITVGASDLANVILILAPGATLSGTITFQPGQTPVPGDLSQIRIAAPPADQASFGPSPNARVEKDGHFTLDGVPAGLHLIRPNGGGALRGWMLKSVTIDGRDVTDTPVEFRSGQKISTVNVVFTDKAGEINGTILDQAGAPVTDYTVLAFSSDPTLWRPQSRHIMTARPDQTGKFRVRGLPAGQYYVTVVDPTEQGEWFEAQYLDQHRIGATSVTLSEGAVKSHDFRVKR